VLLNGPVHPPSWRDPAPLQADFFAVKGVLQGLFDTLGLSWTVEPGSEPFLHPGRSARIKIDGHPAGWLGELHPSIAAEWELTGTVAAFELHVDVVPIPPTALYRDLTSFPAVREDLAVVVEEDVPAADVLAALTEAGAPLLDSAEVFDVYRDPERLGEGNVSLALRLVYRAPDRTLTDEEVAALRERIAEAIGRELGGRIRAS
jgi:phenylalanyl-tRNA synthetase beta chain